MPVVHDKWCKFPQECICADLRAAEKQASRDQDQKDLDDGKITKKELRERNSYFAVDAEVDFGQDDF